MLSVLAALLLAGSATAQQITTTVSLPFDSFGTNKIGFYGSVIGVDKDLHTTLFLEYDNGTDAEAVGRLVPTSRTVTVGSTYVGSSFVFDQLNPLPTLSPSSSNDWVFKDACQWPESPSDAPVACTLSYGPSIAKNLCYAPDTYVSTQLQTLTYSGRLSYSAGVETITRIISAGPIKTPLPDYCSRSGALSDFSGYQYTQSAYPRSSIVPYQVVITAGQAKLATSSMASSTGTGTGAATGSEFTGAAMPMKTAGPMVMGIGAAAAAVFL